MKYGLYFTAKIITFLSCKNTSYSEQTFNYKKSGNGHQYIYVTTHRGLHKADSLWHVVECVQHSTTTLHQTNEISTFRLQSTECDEHFIVVQLLFKTLLQLDTERDRQVAVVLRRRLLKTHTYNSNYLDVNKRIRIIIETFTMTGRF